MEKPQAGVPVIRGEHIRDDGRVSTDWSDYWYVSPDLSNQYPRTKLAVGDIVLSVRGTVGRYGRIGPDHANAQISPNLIRLSPNDAEVWPDYFFYALCPTVESLLSSSVSATTISSLRASDIQKAQVVLPPLPEQKKIAAILGSVDEGIQATQAVIDQTRKVKQGLLAQLLTRGIGHTRFKKTEIGEIPEEWEVTGLSQVAKVIDCKHRTPEYTDHGFAVVRPRDVKEGPLDLSGCIRTSEAEYEDLVENHRPSLGDIVYSRNATFGVAAIVETDERFTIGQDVCVICGTRLAGRFLFYLLNSRVVGQQLDLRSAGSTFKRINLKDIRRFKVPVVEEAEQNRIVSIADSLSEELTLHEAQLSQFAEIKRGLMQDLLTGRIRVNRN